MFKNSKSRIVISKPGCRCLRYDRMPVSLRVAGFQRLDVDVINLTRVREPRSSFPYVYSTRNRAALGLISPFFLCVSRGSDFVVFIFSRHASGTQDTPDATGRESTSYRWGTSIAHAGYPTSPTPSTLNSASAFRSRSRTHPVLPRQPSASWWGVRAVATGLPSRGLLRLSRSRYPFSLAVRVSQLPP